MDDTENSQKKTKTTPVGQYYLMDKIAQGGMAEIFKGLSYDVHGLKKTVCIKKILPHLSANKEFIDSLIDEAKLAVKLVHGNIAQTFDLGKVGDDYFMVMEFVDGKSLSQIHKKCANRGFKIPIPFLIYFISETLNGLNYMHRRTDENGDPLHIVHRDISPQNIMVSYSGTVKIIDFGIAKTTFKAGATDSGILKGKFAYMSPEQAHGDTIDQRSDIFSLGIILHEMLTGNRLFKADDSRQTIRNVRGAKVGPPSSIRSDLTEELDRITMKALSKDRRRRYPFASEMHDDLIKFLFTNYPDFKQSDVSSFLKELFADEKTKTTSQENDSKTPHLIIDRSNSALANDSQFESTGAIPTLPNLGDYMLEPEEPEESEKQEDLPPEVDAVEEEHTLATWRRKLANFRRPLLGGLFYISCGIFLILVVSALFPKKPPAEKTGTFAGLMVVTTPADASVSLDKKFKGKGSPVTIRNIEPQNEHTLEVAKDGYGTHKKEFSLKPGEFASFSVVLSEVKLPNAVLEIISSPSGATVFVDDKETNYHTPAVISDIEPGKEHTIGLYLKSHRFWSKQITLKGGENKSFEVQLVKDFASLSVESEPAHALVMIDNVPVGQAPIAKDDLEPGKIYHIELWLEGYAPFSQEMKAAAGHKEEIRAKLVAEPKKLPSEEKDSK